MAAHAPERVERLVLMGACGVSFPITDGLDRVWGYEPSLATMRGLLDVFAWDPAFATDELATPEDVIAALPHRTLVVHGRDDRVIPLENAHRLLALVDDARLHVFGRCGHWTQIEHADEFNRLVVDFLA